MGGSVPEVVHEVANGLLYREFIAVGLLLKKLNLHDPGTAADQLIRDNWIYIHDKDVLVGRLQIFNNWSPFMVADSSNVGIGAEYFCNEGDEVWRRTDAELVQLAIDELAKIGVILKEDVLEWTVARQLKAYPAYFGTYDRFGEVRKFLDYYENLFLIGRNGMHKYNNMDHSMLTAMTAVDNIVSGMNTKTNIWAVNTEEEYHETKNK